LAYWEGDRDAAGRLARFLADLEPRHSSDADFLLVNRFDCAPVPGLVEDVSRKFNTFSVQSPIIRTGWPDGCNGLAMTGFDWVRSNFESERIPRYKAIFNCESDGGPICADWVARLSAAWDLVNKTRPVYMAGPLIPGNPDHINANALISGDLTFLKWLTLGGPAHTITGGGWDYLLAREFKRMGWANISEMRSYYNSPHFTEEQYAQMRKENLIWVHGIKDNSLIDLGRIWLLGGKNAGTL
jgi:hypothetical protein